VIELSLETWSSRERQLDVAAVVVHALLEVTAAGDRLDPEAERRRREAHAVIAGSALPTAVFVADGLRPLLANAAWEALFPKARWPELEPKITAMYAGRAAAIHVAELALDSTGRPAHCAATLRTTTDAAGAVTGVIVVCIPTTDEVLARELGVGSDALIWSAPISADADYYNARWHGYAGVTDAGWQAAIEPEDLARCTAALAEATRERRSSEIDVRLRALRGEVRWHRVRFNICPSNSRWYGVAIDTHALRAAEARVDQAAARERAARADAELANRLKDQFLATVSHELRAPVTTMLLWAKVLADDTSDAVLRKRALDAISESALLQSHLVGDLLDVSRAVSGKLFVDLRPVDIEAVVAAAVAAIAEQARDRGVSVTWRGGAGGAEVQGDAARIRQVLGNLLSNAVKFTEPGGTITIDLARSADTLAVDVTDTGRGIAAEFLSRLFEPFSQTEDMLTRRAGGLGLGLAIARQLVELHHGTLTATSPGPGKGATFTVTLPLAKRSAALQPRGSRIGRTRAPVLEGVAVLVIDDDRRVRDALALLLRRAGANVESADSARAARVHLEAHAPDVILCDIAMPDEDGYGFIERLRRSSITIPAIALTAHATESDSRRAHAAGFDVHLAKPVDFDRLVVAIDRLITARRSEADT
jgi:signal transduction histidine kinase/CheY-like chemotaxis protein